MNRSLRVANSQQVVGLREVASRLPQTAQVLLVFVWRLFWRGSLGFVKTFPQILVVGPFAPTSVPG